VSTIVVGGDACRALELAALLLESPEPPGLELPLRIKIHAGTSDSGCAGARVTDPGGLRDRSNTTLGRRLDVTARRRVAIHLAVRPGAIVLGGAIAKDLPPVRFARHDHVIQALSSKRA
jgi:hypothetical protein